MMTMVVTSQTREEAIDVTADVRRLVRDGGFSDGTVCCFVPHTTAGIMINERADPDVPRDLYWKLRDLIPKQDSYHHGEGNSDAHLKTALVGSSVLVPLVNGSLQLGAWQAIFFCEFDGPRQRHLHITVLRHA